jgi:glutamine synthetase type III
VYKFLHIGVRDDGDAMEKIVPADQWTLQTYTDLLFLDQTSNLDAAFED